jgi:hypothetical protein
VKSRIAALALSVAALTPGLVGAIAVASGTPSASAQTSTSTSYSGTLREAVRSLPLASEVRTGYNRDLFPHWIDADKDCQNTRIEVLRAESTVTPSGGCYSVTGKWYSYYDGITITDSGSLDIDHVVPLAEAWDSGARTWTTETRQRYANDLGDGRSLVAVTANSNRSKGDQDPGEWQPLKQRCRYAAQWTATKIRWNLSVNTAEKNALITLADNCPAATVNVAKAPIYKSSTSTGTSTGSTTGLRVTGITYKGATLNDEYVTFKNTTSASINVSGWSIVDGASHKFSFASRSVAAGASFRLHTGSGTATTTDAYWGSGSGIWNDTGDSFTLANPNGSTAQTGSYGSGTGTVTF